MDDDINSFSDEQLQAIAGSSPDLSQMPSEDLEKVAATPATPSRTESATRGLGQGLFLGYEPQLMGAAAQAGLAEAGMYNPDMIMTPAQLQSIGQQTTESEKQANIAAQQANPWTYGAGNVVGSIAPATIAPEGFLGGALVGGISGSSEGDTAAERAKNALVGGVSGGLINKALGFFHGTPSPETQKLVSDASKMGIDIPNYLASEIPAVKSFAGAIKYFPISGAPIEKAAQNTMQQMGKVAENIGGVDPEVSGSIFGDAIKNWITKDSHDIADNYYTKVSNLMNNNVLTPLNNTASTAQQILSRRGAMNLDQPSGAVNTVFSAITNPNGLSYQGIKDLRSFIGRKLSSGVLPEDTDGAELKQIYGALSEDLNSAASNAGGVQGKQAHDLANSIYNAISDKRKALLPLIGGEKAGASSEKVFSNILNAANKNTNVGNLEMLRQAKSVMNPEDWQTAVRGVVAQMGRDANGNFLPSQFIGGSGYNKLSEGGKDLLFGAPGTVARDNLDTLADVSNRFKDVSKYANTSGTAHAIAISRFFESPIDWITSTLGATGVSKAISAPATPAGAALSIPTMVGKTGIEAARAAALSNAPAIGPTALGWGLSRFPLAQPQQGHAAGGRVPRKSGGKVQSGHQHLVDRLFRLGEQAKKTEKAHTEPLLDLPDETVAKALDVAQRAI
jgi:hypothetical protein